MQNEIFEAALGISSPWYINGVDFEVERKALSIPIDFIAGSRFAYPGILRFAYHASSCRTGGLRLSSRTGRAR